MTDFIILLICIFAFIFFIGIMLSAAFGDTETFRAIDERIARLIRGGGKE